MSNICSDFTFIFPSGNSVWARTIQTFLYICHCCYLLPALCKQASPVHGGRAVSTGKNAPSLWFLASHTHVHTGHIANNPITHLLYTYTAYFFILRVGVDASSLHTNFQKRHTHSTVMCNRSVEFVNAEEMDLPHLPATAHPQGPDKISLSVFSLVLMKNSEDLEKAKNLTKI